MRPDESRRPRFSASGGGGGVLGGRSGVGGHSPIGAAGVGGSGDGFTKSAAGVLGGHEDRDRSKASGGGVPSGGGGGPTGDSPSAAA